MGKKEPAHKIQLGNISVAIWENESEDQEVWFNVSVSRSYKDGDRWKDTSSFRRNDLPIVSKGVDLALMWILVRERRLSQTSVTETDIRSLRRRRRANKT